jgi:hypothetical protein
MSRRLAVLVACAMGVLLPSAAAHADNPVLVATVGLHDGFNISLKDSAGNVVRHLDPGTYTIQVQDASALHDFHLLGPGGVDQATSVDAIENVTWTVTFVDGTYTFHCDVHSNIMHGSFTVGAVPAAPTPIRLKGNVGPGRTISLRDADGTRVTTVTGATPAVITVTDRSKTDNFHLTGPGVKKATGVGFRGRVVWRVNLVAGNYLYRSDKHKKLRGSFAVTSS